MRYREPYTLIPRRVGNKVIWYYRTYDSEGKRTTARSTGQTTKTAARAYCAELDKAGKLIPVKFPLFSDYSRNWFIYDQCRYIQGTLARGGSYSRKYADTQQGFLKNHILPVFGNTPLDRICPPTFACADLLSASSSLFGRRSLREHGIHALAPRND